MGYHVITTADLEPTPDRPSSRYAIGEAASLEGFAINRYDAAPGEDVPLAYHYHTEQEEALYVIAGTLHVETPEGEFVLGPDETFVAEPGSPHRAFNPDDADGTVSIVAVGAPRVDDAEVFEP